MAVALATLPLKRLAAETADAFLGIAAGAGFAAGLAGVVFATAALLTARGWAAGLETGLADATAFFAGGAERGLAVFTTGFAADVERGFFRSSHASRMSFVKKRRPRFSPPA